MSADNGVYICRFKDGYRVIEGFAIDNLDYFEPGSKEEKLEWKRYWEKAPLYNNKDDAILAAHKLADSIDVLEYGVVMLRGEGVDWRDSVDDLDKDDEAIHDNTNDFMGLD